MCSKLLKILYFFVILFLISTTKTFASILINEVSPKTDPEWVKLYNDGDTDVDLTGYQLKDGNSIDTDDLYLTGIIPSKGYLTFYNDKHWLNNDTDTLKLYNNSTPSAVIAEYSYPTPTTTPTQTSTPQPTAVPTPTTTPTSTVTATAKPTPAKTSTPKSTSSPTPTQSGQADEPITFEKNDSIVLPTATSTGLVAGASTSNNKSKTIAITLIFFGVCFLGYCGFLIYNSKNAKVEGSS